MAHFFTCCQQDYRADVGNARQGPAGRAVATNIATQHLKRTLSDTSGVKSRSIRRQLEHERGALSWLAGDADFAAMGDRQLAGDPQAQPETAVVPAGDGPLEALEDALLVFRSDADAVIAHGDERHAVAHAA